MFLNNYTNTPSNLCVILITIRLKDAVNCKFKSQTKQNKDNKSNKAKTVQKKIIKKKDLK